MKQEIGFEIRTISNLLKRRMEMCMPHGPLTYMQARTIGFLFENNQQNCYQRDLERAFQIRRSTATEIINHLERAGYLVREPVPHDRRLKKLAVTEKSRTCHQIARQQIAQTEALLRSVLTAEEISQFFSISEKIKRSLSVEPGTGNDAD